MDVDELMGHQQKRITELKKLIGELVEVVEFYAQDKMFKGVYIEKPNFGSRARKLQNTVSYKKFKNA